MKANEFRIGNLIGATWKDQIHKVTTDTINEVEEFPKSYFPIPLTEEWLLRFGFKRIKEDKSFEICHIYFDLNVYLPGNYVSVVSGMDEVSINYDLKNVHQLQNLYFALTGEELTFKEEVKP